MADDVSGHGSSRVMRMSKRYDPSMRQIPYLIVLLWMSPVRANNVCTYAAPTFRSMAHAEEHAKASEMRKISPRMMKDIQKDHPGFAHELKSEIAGGSISKFNLYTDSKGYIFIRRNDGDHYEPTGFSLDSLE